MNATLLVNSAARGVKASFDPTRMVRYLEKRGVTTALMLPDSAADATVKARASAERRDDLLFAVGGDGTMRDVAKGLAGSETALAAVPGGTVNIWAKEAGIPNTMRAAGHSWLESLQIGCAMRLLGPLPGSSSRKVR